MKTDSLFYKLFLNFPGTFFELIQRSPEDEIAYRFSSVELKETSFRMDGLFLPKEDVPNQMIFFVEVQFQNDPDFYSRFLTEIFLYLRTQKPTQDWQAVVLYPDRQVEPPEPTHYREFFASGRVQRLYLEDLQRVAAPSLGLGVLQLIIMPPAQSREKVQQLLTQAHASSLDRQSQQNFLELIERVLIYKLPGRSREEIEAMFGLDELKQTRFYQEAMQDGGAKIILRLLDRRFGPLSVEWQAQIQQLSNPQLESLADALFDFRTLSDLGTWLQVNAGHDTEQP